MEYDKIVGEECELAPASKYCEENEKKKTIMTSQ